MATALNVCNRMKLRSTVLLWLSSRDSGTGLSRLDTRGIGVESPSFRVAAIADGASGRLASGCAEAKDTSELKGVEPFALVVPFWATAAAHRSTKLAVVRQNTGRMVPA